MEYTVHFTEDDDELYDRLAALYPPEDFNEKVQKLLDRETTLLSQRLRFIAYVTHSAAVSGAMRWESSHEVQIIDKTNMYGL